MGTHHGLNGHAKPGGIPAYMRYVEPELDLVCEKPDLERATSKVFLAKLKKLLAYAGCEGKYRLFATSWAPAGAREKEGVIEISSPNQHNVVLFFQQGGPRERIKYFLSPRRPDDAFSFHRKLQEAFEHMVRDEREEEQRHHSVKEHVAVKVQEVIQAPALPPESESPQPTPTDVQKDAAPMFASTQAFLQDVVTTQTLLLELTEKCAEQNALLTRDLVMETIVRYGLQNRMMAAKAFRHFTEAGYLRKQGETYAFGTKAAALCGVEVPKPPLVDIEIDVPEQRQPSKPDLTPLKSAVNQHAQIRKELATIQAQKKQLVAESRRIHDAYEALKARESELKLALAASEEVRKKVDEITQLFMA